MDHTLLTSEGEARNTLVTVRQIQKYARDTAAESPAMSGTWTGEGATLMEEGWWGVWIPPNHRDWSFQGHFPTQCGKGPLIIWANL